MAAQEYSGFLRWAAVGDAAVVGAAAALAVVQAAEDLADLVAE